MHYFLRVLIGVSTLAILQIAALVWGWGLSPKSWLVILVVGVVAPTAVRFWLEGELSSLRSGGGEVPTEGEEQ